MYLNSGIIGSSHGYQQPAQHSHYTSGPPPKKRRATNSKVTPHIQSAPLPTPTSGTYPPGIKHSRPSDASASDTTSHPSPGDTRTHPPPFTPPLNNSNLHPSSTGTTTSGIALPFSPTFSFSPLPQFASLAPSPVSRPATLESSKPTSTSISTEHHLTLAPHFDPTLSMTPGTYDQQPTPGAGSTSGASAHTDAEKDPFLSLLEQLAENEVSRGGPSELDFFLGGQGG